MVFENLIASVINRFLADYVEELDSRQLNLNVTGGIANLADLQLKESALDDLNLPFKLKYGYISKLALKFSPMNPFASRTTADMEGLYIIVVPNKGVKYSEEKEAKDKNDEKQKALQRLENERKKQRHGTEAVVPMDDSFIEKMTAQVFNNLQVNIKDIHFRFEDKYTNRHRPYALGFTLESLQFESTDSSWKPTIPRETKLIYKLIAMNNLTFYWNSNVTEFISDLTDKTDIRNALKNEIATDKHRPSDQQYILEPISISARLQLNKKPEADGTNWKTPKILLTVSVKLLALHIAQRQYQDFLLLLEEMERFTLAERYLKYRPDLLEYNGHARTWWKFAYTCILEEEVRRKARNWSWQHMKEHRDLARSYKVAWLEKITNPKASKETLLLIERAERDLDVFNLNIARQQADMKVDRKKLTRVEDQPEQGWVSWATGGWFQSKSKSKAISEPDESSEGDDLRTQFKQEMTPEEQQKLFAAIDYEENAPPNDYPEHYVETKVDAILERLLITFEHNRGGKSHTTVLTMKLDTLKAHLLTRQAYRAINFDSAIENVVIYGLATNGKQSEPTIVEMGNKQDKQLPLMRFVFDTNPLSHAYDRMVSLTIAPVFIYYNSPTVNMFMDIFRPPESVRLNQLLAAAMARYEDVKARSITGLAHVVDSRTKIVIDIAIHPATIILPITGVYTPQSTLIIADLGSLTVRSVDAGQPRRQSSQDDRRQDILHRAYDQFALELRNVQLMFCKSTDDWRNARASASSMHLLEPVGMDIDFYRASVDDPQLAKMMVHAHFMRMNVHLQQEALTSLMAFVQKALKDMDEAQKFSIEEAASLTKKQTDNEEESIRQSDDYCDASGSNLSDCHRND